MSAVVSASFLFVFAGLAVFPVANRPDDTQAANTISETTLAMTTADIALEFDVNNPNGTFSASDPTEFTVTTNNYSGYTLSISAKENDADNSKLINGEYEFNSISSASSQNDFANGTWGYKPSKINSAANTDFLPAPSYTGDTLDVTAAANNEANTYSIALGAKADYTLPAGEYNNTFVITAIANPVGYQISYSENTEDTVTNMPSAQSGDVTATEVTIASEIPVRTNYSFNGWCSGTVTTANEMDSCSTTVYQPEEVLSLTQTAANILSLKAMWNSTLPPIGTLERTFYDAGKTKATANDGEDYYRMQDMNATICNAVTTPTNTTDYSDTSELQLVDIRDGKTYWVAKLMDGRCWMTQNLDHNIVTTTNFYTPANTDVKVNTTMNRATIPSTDIDSNGEIAGWSGSTSLPFSVDLGDWYSNGTYYNSSECPDNSSDGYRACNFTNSYANGKFSQTAYAANGEHGQVGVSYNWSAAIASNDSSSFTVDSLDAETSICPAGWRLPTATDGNEYSTLLSAYNVPNSSDEKAFTSPLYFNRVGGAWANNGSLLRDAGNYGVYWTSTNASTGNAYSIKFQSDLIDANFAFTKTTGRAVRCIARTDNEPTSVVQAFASENKTTATVNSENYYKIQEMTASVCNKITKGQTGKLVDVRDNTIYNVGKLEDDRCWLLDNLALDLVANKNILSSANTNATDTQLNYLKNGGGTTSNQWATAGIANWTSSNSYSAPLQETSDKGVVPNNTEDSMNSAVVSGGWKMGVRYNYCAASAGTYCWGNGTSYTNSPSSDPNTSSLYDIGGDICPYGWRIPTGSPTQIGDYDTLLSSYNSYTSFRTAFRVPLKNDYDNIYSSTWGRSDSQIVLYVHKTNASYNYWTGAGWPRSNRYYIRCIAK